MIPEINEGSIRVIKEVSLGDILPEEAHLIVTDAYRWFDLFALVKIIQTN